MGQCECATKFEWTSEMVTLEHHPLCGHAMVDVLETFDKSGLQFVDVQLPDGEKTRIYERAPGESDYHLLNSPLVFYRPDPPGLMMSDRPGRAEELVFGWQATPAPRTVEELTQRMESMFPVCPVIGVSSHAPTGERYITFGLGGVIEEGEGCPLMATSIEAACAQYWKDWLAFSWKHFPESTLYWREKPNLAIRTCGCADVYSPIDYYRGHHTDFMIWSVLLLSDKPVMSGGVPPVY